MLLISIVLLGRIGRVNDPHHEGIIAYNSRSQKCMIPKREQIKRVLLDLSLIREHDLSYIRSWVSVIGDENLEMGILLQAHKTNRV